MLRFLRRDFTYTCTLKQIVKQKISPSLTASGIISKFRNCSRSVKIHTRIRIGANALHQHLNKIGTKKSGLCPQCNQDPHTAEHVLFKKRGKKQIYFTKFVDIFQKISKKMLNFCIFAGSYETTSRIIIFGLFITFPIHTTLFRRDHRQKPFPAFIAYVNSLQLTSQDTE